MSKRRFYFHLVMILTALLIGGLSLWYSGFWMEGRNKVPNFTAIAMVLMAISQVIALRTGLKKGREKIYGNEGYKSFNFLCCTFHCFAFDRWGFLVAYWDYS